MLDGDDRSELVFDVAPLCDEFEPAPPPPLAAAALDALGHRVLVEQVGLHRGGVRGAVVGGAGDAADRLHPGHSKPGQQFK